VLSLLAHRTRLRVLYALAAAERTSGELCVLTGKTQIMFNRHLSLIRAAGLVETRKDGRFGRCSLSPLGRADVALLKPSQRVSVGFDAEATSRFRAGEEGADDRDESGQPVSSQFFPGLGRTPSC